MRKRREDWDTNRSAKRNSRKSGKHWCMGCDACLIGPGEKCPNCGNKSMPRRNKKG